MLLFVQQMTATDQFPEAHRTRWPLWTSFLRPTRPDDLYGPVPWGPQDQMTSMDQFPEAHKTRWPLQTYQMAACTRPQNHQLSITQKTTAIHPSSNSTVNITPDKKAIPTVNQTTKPPNTQAKRVCVVCVCAEKRYWARQLQVHPSCICPLVSPAACPRVSRL